MFFYFIFLFRVIIILFFLRSCSLRTESACLISLLIRKFFFEKEAKEEELESVILSRVDFFFLNMVGGLFFLNDFYFPLLVGINNFILIITFPTVLINVYMEEV